MATPFHPTAGEPIDVPSFHRAIHFMREAGVTGVTVAGVLGESNRITDGELTTIVTEAVAAAGPMPVCLGISHAGTAATADRAALAAECGAAAVMVTPLKEPVPTPPGKILEHFAAVAKAAPGIDIVLQDHPASTQVHMPLPLIDEIAREVPTVRCIKLESTPTPARTAELLRLFGQSAWPADSTPPTILTGLGGLYGGFELAAGADGFMTGFAFPEVLIAMVTAAKLEGGMPDCMRIFKEYLPLIVFEQQPGVAVRKHIYKMRGLFDAGHVRQPGGQISPAAAAMVEQLVEETFPLGVSAPLDI